MALSAVDTNVPNPTVYAKVAGSLAAIREVTKLPGLARMQYYQAVLGDLYQMSDQREFARLPYQRAIKLTSSQAERELPELKQNRL